MSETPNEHDAADGDRVLLADIGGTNARFALMQHGKTSAIEHMKVADFPTATAAIQSFIARHATGEQIAAAVLGVAGPVQNNRIVITNSGWTVDGSDLRKRFGFGLVRLLNDFEALAWSLPELAPDDLVVCGGQQTAPGAPMLVLGPGTGFGAACLFPQPSMPLAAVTEAGHATLPAASEREESVIGHLRRRFAHVSIERVLSGSGLVNLYAALAAVDGIDAPDRDPAAITDAALDGSCGLCRAALDMFCSLLGEVAGNLALTFCARGGVYIAGGIVPRFADHLARSNFRARFERKGRYESYLRNIPTHIIVRHDASFAGLKAFFEKRMAARPESANRTGA
jgi:glucokinase